MLAAKYDDGAELVLAARFKDCGAELVLAARFRDCGAFCCGATLDGF